MGHFLKSFIGLAAVSTLSLSVAGLAEAGNCKGRKCQDERYGYEESGAYRYVTANATFGGKTVTAPVRHGRWGDEVRTPGGNWVDCEITCEYTLRRLTVDFWDSVGSNGFVSPGYFRYEYDLDTGEAYRTGPRIWGRY